MSETKTPIYLENVLHLFEKYNAYMHRNFMPRGEVGSANVDLSPLTDALLQIKDVLANTSSSSGGSDWTVEQINKLIDQCLEERISGFDGGDLTAVDDDDFQSAVAALSN